MVLDDNTFLELLSILFILFKLISKQIKLVNILSESVDIFNFISSI